MRSVATALTLRRTEVGPFSVGEADAERVVLARRGAGTDRADGGRGGGRAGASTASGVGAARRAAAAACALEERRAGEDRRTPVPARAPAAGRRDRDASTGSIEVTRGSSEAAIDSGLAPTVITFDPHPRIALGNDVELITTLERRLELFAEPGIEATLVASFTPELMALEPEAFAERYLRAIGAEAVIAGGGLPLRLAAPGDLELLDRLGFEVLEVETVPDVSSSAIRRALHEGDVVAAARMLGRPYELDGIVVAGDQRGGTLGYPTANLALEPHLALPARTGSTPAAALGHRAAVSIGTNPHYGGTERRIEPFLLDFDGDLYGKRLVVEVWERLRDEAVFASEEELVAQIGRDVEATRAAVRPSAPLPDGAHSRAPAAAGDGSQPAASASGLTTPIGAPAAKASTWANACAK